MSTADTRNPDEIQREIHRTQNEMSRTVDRLGDQFSFKKLINSLLDKAEDNDVEARDVVDTARRNPIALGMISIGTIWLVSERDAKIPSFSSDGKSTRSQGYDSSYDRDPDHHGYIEHMSRFERRQDEDEPTYLRRRDEHRGTYLMIERDHEENHSSYRERLDKATEQVRERRDQFAEGARQRADQLSRAGSRGINKVERTYEQNPLLGGLAAAMVGAIAGAVIPASRTEREYLGPQGAEALHMAGDKARQLGEEARHQKDKAVDQAERKLDEQQNSQGEQQGRGQTTPVNA